MNIEFLINRAGMYGGVKRIYCVAAYLRDAGHQVVVNSDDGKTNAWFEHNILENTAIDADIRICAETCRRPLKDAINILYQQAQFDAPEPDEPFDIVVTTTKYLAEFLERVSGIKPHYQIPYGIDTTIFKWIPPSPLWNVAYMPRKNREEFDLIMQLMPSDLKSKINWIAIDGLSETDVAVCLQSSNIFLALSRDEGFGLPPFEAALCGCLVIGYHGRGGKEWLTDDTCVLTGTPQEFPLRLREALDGNHESKRFALYNLVLQELSVEKEKTAWLTVINHAAKLQKEKHAY